MLFMISTAYVVSSIPAPLSSLTNSPSQELIPCRLLASRLHHHLFSVCKYLIDNNRYIAVEKWQDYLGFKERSFHFIENV